MLRLVPSGPGLFQSVLAAKNAKTATELRKALAGEPVLELAAAKVFPQFRAQRPGIRVGEWIARLNDDLPLVALESLKQALLPSVRDRLVEAIDAADSFSELGALLNGSELAARPATEALHQLGLPRVLRAFAESRLSLGVFLAAADEADVDDEGFFLLLDSIKDLMMAQIDQRPSPPKLDLTAWGLPDLPDWTMQMLRDYRFGTGLTLAQLVAQGRGDEVQRALEAFRPEFERARAARPLSPGRAAADSAQPHLETVEALLAELPRYPRTFHSDVRLAVQGVDVGANVQLWVQLARTTELVFRDFWAWPTTRRLDCSCARPACIHRVLVLERLRDALQSTHATELIDATRPPWVRLLSEPPPRAVAARKKPGALSFTLGGEAALEVRFHEVGKKGVSKSGRIVPLGSVLARLERVDQAIAEQLMLANDAAPPSPHFGRALLSLVGHPRVRWGESDFLPVERVEPSAAVEPHERGYTLRFHLGVDAFAAPLFSGEGPEGPVVVMRAGGRIVVAEVSHRFLHLANQAHRLGAVVPEAARAQLVEQLPSIEASTVIELPAELRGHEVPASTTLSAQLEREGSGPLMLRLVSEPLDGGARFAPGQGSPVSASFDGKVRRFARRAFEREVAVASARAAELGLDPSHAVQPWTWALDTSAQSIETLRRLSASDLRVEWKAPRVRFTAEAKLSALQLSVTRKRDWFGLEGTVTVDERRVSLALLLEAARQRRRYVQLGENDFVQLSTELLDGLAPIAHAASSTADPEVTLGLAPVLAALEPQVESVKAVAAWNQLMDRLGRATRATFPVPRDLKATLREYQREGFEWLSRLAQWGVGACLADDMGLGKTLQALAVLVSRAKEGPALVVAPSSVLHTWVTEARRFAPRLKLSLHHESDRTVDVGAGEVLVVSWSLFARDADQFAARKFATVVLDEAHAIKNANTQRARAAHRLQTDFLIALSGTPIENHVGELWSLFRAVMPSLLGSEESFQRRFGSGRPEALQALAQLIQPFVLRRTKAAVAKELPARTDLEVLVPLTEEERALYEDVRLSAMQSLGEINGESKRFDVLAALTRLRLTACHPRLNDPSWKGPTSKLSRLLELVSDLSEGGHKVLVFSQFTKHLALVREAFEARGLGFTYLDGEVPVAERQRRVESFQAGKGGVAFLISLKAGGTGLTLTAADYVIHLDPWWNPAVEDQASDRAHRIGQTRPVTVYRLIAEGTIEQQILSLHAEKRELVDALLSGADSAGKLSTTALAALIRGT
jgi:superfamily II DNA or RNA helicase